MIKQKLCIALLTLLSVLETVAQNGSPQLLKVVPPSPTVASLGKYGEVPVSLYTGVPNISIPLYEIKDGSLDLPVTLSYHAGGVRVEEVASSVGLGWTLNAGGVIGRNVRGLPDEIGNWQSPGSGNSVEKIMLSGNYSQTQQLVKDVDAGYRDGEADMYYYNFNQFSGKFFFDQKGEVHTVPAKNLLISPIAYGWKVTTEDGTVYSFTNAEEVSSANCSDYQTTQTAWFLTSIKSVDDKREIRFSYDPVNYTYETLIGQTKYFSINSTDGLCLQNPNPCVGTQNYNTPRLVKIDFDGGYINFSYNAARCDLIGDRSLNEIAVYNNKNELVKKLALSYSYFGNNNDGCNFFTRNKKRLKLGSLTEESINSQNPPYVFEYNESIQLPDRLSYAQDHWGYYNGKINNSGLIAAFSTTVLTGAQINFPGADRTANPATAQAGILTKIKYPTGGETLFTYESNTVSDNQVESETKTSEQTIVLTANQIAYNLPYPYFSNELTIPAPGADVQFSVSGLSASIWPGCDFVQCAIIKDNNPIPFGQLGNSWNGVTAFWQAGKYKLRLTADCDMTAIASFSVSVTSKIPVTTTKTLEVRPVGGLRIKQIEARSGIAGQSVIKKYRYHAQNDTVHSSGVLVNFPDYGYDLGVTKYTIDDHGSPGGPANYCMYRVRQSFSNYPLATTQGSYVGYSHVIEDLGESGESWYSFDAYPDKTAAFPYAPVENLDWSRGFLRSTKDFVRKNGSLILAKETTHSPTSLNQFKTYGIKTGRDFLNIGDTRPDLQPLPKYSFYPTITELYALGQTKEKLYDQNDPTKFIETVIEYTYSPKHLQMVQSKTVTSKSDQAMTEEIVSNKKYPFDYTFTSSPSGTEALGIKNLQDLHVASAVIEEYVVKQNRNTTNNKLSDQRIIGGGITTYKTNKPYPDQLFRLETGSPLPLTSFGIGSFLNADLFMKNADASINNSFKPAVIFNSYDDNGNITTQQKADDVKKSYVWGYNSSYPVAEVTGVDYDAVIATANVNLAILQNASTSDEEMRTELNKIRLAFPSAQVITYTYKPLVGITSQTDPNNRTTYYEYDGFGRLSLIRDQDRNILKTICYNYSGQQENCNP